VYTSTRPFDDPALLLQLTWEPMVPHVTINLYQVGTAPDGSQSLKMVDSTQTSSWDDWAQGFRSDHVPNMNCPGQSTTDPFFYTMKDQPNYLDWYNAQHGGVPAVTALPNDSQYKCYDGMHNWNQLQPRLTMACIISQHCGQESDDRRTHGRHRNGERHELHYLHHGFRRQSHAAGRQVRSRGGCATGL